jgi:iron complex transport system substrate-binding protein
MRICSFLPSATEILYALGLGDSVAGVTYECDFPAEARQKPVVVRTRLQPTSSSAELDRQVSDFVSRGESLYRVDIDKLAELDPDLIVTQDLCQVCAASPGDLVDALSRLRRRPQVLSLTPNTMTEVFADIGRVGEATGRTAVADELTAALESTVARTEEAVAKANTRPRVLCLEWLDPPYVGGHWVPEMVARAGGTDVLGRPGQRSRRVTWEDVLGTKPEVIVVMPCGYDLAETVAEFRGTKLPAGWNTLPAVQAGRVFAVDASSYFSRPGPRLARGFELLAGLLHPGRAASVTPAESVQPL